MFDVLTIGAGVRDVFLRSDQFKLIRSPKFSTGTGECVALGGKIEIEDLVFSTGGGATNAAVTFARLGYKTSCICRIGTDLEGRAVAADLRTEGVDVSHIQIDKQGHTAYSTLLTAENGERSVLVYRGVASDLDPKRIPASLFEKTKWVFLTSLGGDFRRSKAIIAAANKAGAQIFWNPGGKELAAGWKSIAPLLPMVTVFSINKEEAELLTKKTRISAMAALFKMPCLITLVTDGPKGAYAIGNGIILHVGTTGVSSVSSTGAGDAFGSGFLAAFMKTGDVSQSLPVGVINAESVIGHLGAKMGLIKEFPTERTIKKIPISIVTTL